MPLKILLNHFFVPSKGMHIFVICIWWLCPCTVCRYVSENVQGNVERLSNVIQHLIDDVERQLQSVDSTFYSSSIFSETLIHRNGSVGRPKLVINLTHIDYLRSWQFT